MVFLTFLISLSLLIVILVYAFIFKDLVNPILLMLGPVLFGYILYYFYFQNIWKLSDSSLLAYLSSIFFILLGYGMGDILTFRYTKKLKEWDYNDVYTLNHVKVIPMLFWTIGFILCLATVYHMKSLGIDSGVMRDYFIDNVSTFPFYVIYGKYFLVFAISFISYQGLSYGWSKSRTFFVISGTVVAMLAALSTQSRTDLMIVVLPLLINITVLKIIPGSRKQFVKYFIQIVGGLLIVYTLLHVIQVARFGDSSSPFFSSQNQMFQYIGMPLVAFDKWLVAPKLAGVMHGWGVVELTDKIAPFLNISVPTLQLAPVGQFNVYSFLAAPYAAFDNGGFIILMIFVGLGLAILYKNVLIKKGLYLIFYSLFADSIFLSFFTWQLMSMVNVYAIIFVLLLKIESRVRR